MGEGLPVSTTGALQGATIAGICATLEPERTAGPR